MYGETFVLEGKDYESAINMLEHAEALLPSNLGIRINLAEAYAGTGRNDEALVNARSVMAWAHEESDASKRARNLLTSLGEPPPPPEVTGDYLARVKKQTI